MLKSIRNKILLSELGLLFLISLVFGLASYILTVRYQKKAQREKLELILEDEKKFLQISLSNKVKLMDEISRSNELRIYSVRFTEPILFHYFVLFEKDFFSLTYVNKNGMEEVKIVGQSKSSNLKNISDSIYFKNALRNPNKVIISPVKYDEELKMPVIELFLSNYDYFGDELNFVLSGIVPVYDITKNISDIKIGETGFAVLIDKEGRILSLTCKNDLLKTIEGKGSNKDKLIEKAKALQSGFERANILGKDSLVAYSPVSNMEWSLMAVMPYDEYMSLSNTLRNIIIIISMLIFALGGLISLILSYNITKPIKQLVSVTFDVASGDFSKKSEVVSEDEIGMLSGAFNIMTENLEKTTVSKDYFDSILSNMSDVLIVTDKDFKILTINKAGIDLSGYNEDEIIGKPLFDFFEKSKTASFNEDSVILENDKFKNFEIIFKQKDKKGVYALFSTAELKDKSGKTKYFICTVKDISERKKAEEELKEYTRRIEAINRELDSYTYIVSHDLKEPLRSINGFSRFIISDYKDKLDETGQNYLDRIRANAIRIQSIVEDFLAVSYIDKKINSFEDVCLEEVMDDVKTRMEKKINQKGAEIIIKEKMPVIFCNRPGITDVFSNLASNAIKFADKKSIRIEIGWREDEEFYEFYVKDNGPGIEEQYFDKIFELFHRLVKREEYKGTGVGLTIAKKIVEIHRGKIWVKSKAGEGATFYFTIPRNKDIILAGAMKAINRNH